MSRLLPTLTALLAFLAAGAVRADLAATLPGSTWQLVKVVPPSLEILVPRGIPAVKEYYAPDGKLYFIGPEDALTPSTQWSGYTLSGDQRTTRIDGRLANTATLRQPDADTLVVSQGGGDTWIYRRLRGDKPYDTRIEPVSVEYLPGTDTSKPFPYDTADYSAQAPAQRVRGVWEAIAHARVPREEAPPYGFLNDLWVFGPERFHVISRVPGEEVESTRLPYQVAGDAITYRGLRGEPRRMAFRFNDWGHLVLERDGHRIVLKLVQKDTAAPAPRPPLRVTLTSLLEDE